MTNDVECPSLSPDGTRVAYKVRHDDGLGLVTWTLAVLDLKTMARTGPGRNSQRRRSSGMARRRHDHVRARRRQLLLTPDRRLHGAGRWVRPTDTARRSRLVAGGRSGGLTACSRVGPRWAREPTERLVHHRRPMARRMPLGRRSSHRRDPEPRSTGAAGSAVHPALRQLRALWPEPRIVVDRSVPDEPSVGIERHAAR